MKKCNKCGIKKSLGCYQKDKQRTDGLRYECKDCTSLLRKKNYCQTRNRKNALKQRFKNKDAESFYSDKIQEQQGVCAICKNPENGRYVHLSIDHNHETGQLRGLLCNNCNRALGLFKDSIDVLNSAVKYLSSKTRSML